MAPKKEKNEKKDIFPKFHPVNTSDKSKLVKHDKQFNFLLNQLFNHDKKRTHHVVCLVGEKGIGKATTLYSAIKEYLRKFDLSKDNEKNSVEILKQNSHPDIFILEPDHNSESGEILIDQTRKMIDFVSLKPSYLKIKIVIIDSLDLLGLNSGNSILKTLEDYPQNTYFFITCHNTNNALKPLLSRCCIMKCKKLTEKDFFDVFDFNSFNLNYNLGELAVVSDFNVSSVIDIDSCEAMDLYNEMLNDLGSNKTNSTEVLKKMKCSNFMKFLFIKNFVERILRNLIYISCGYSRSLTENENNAFFNFLHKSTFTPNDLFKRLSDISEIIYSSKIYNANLQHLLVFCINMITIGKTRNSSSQFLYF